jgi:FMN-dependent NADH-azoreductase
LGGKPAGLRPEATSAKYKGVNKELMNQAETAVWDKIQGLALRFQQASRIVLGVPMWNYADPYKLKHLIDLACQRNMLFTYDGKECQPFAENPPRLRGLCARRDLRGRLADARFRVRPSERIH